MEKDKLKDEKMYLKKTNEIIDKNIKFYNKEVIELDKKVKVLNDLFNSSNPELWNELMLTINFAEKARQLLLQNNQSIEKPYFGKLNFTYKKEGEKEEIYIGKRGLSYYENSLEPIIIDWRAPVSDLYYSGNLGENSFFVGKNKVEVDIENKRTFEIEDRKLIDFYDIESITNDDLLIKFLSKNKDGVLNDIVSSIQSEQNNIIRCPYYKNVIVQGVAGSGKTTVAIHRIAFIAYQTNKDYNSNNIYLIASSKLFLNYIASMLPDLDVTDINQNTMILFFYDQIKNWDKSFKIKNIYNVLLERNNFDYATIVDGFNFEMESIEKEIFYIKELVVFNQRLITLEEIINFNNPLICKDFTALAIMLDKRIENVLANNKQKIIDFIGNNRNNDSIIKECKLLFKIDSDFVTEEMLTKNYTKFATPFKSFFKKRVKKLKYLDIYNKILIDNNMQNINKDYTLLDLTLIALIQNKICLNTNINDIRQIIIDEAQDFDTFVYYCLNTIFVNSRFTIVGDIMQNIRNNGIESWKNILSNIFNNGTEFFSLQKSYRNTIEISEYANKALTNFKGDTYKVMPVLRHGDPIEIYEPSNIDEKLECINNIVNIFNKSNNNILAIICKDEKERDIAHILLSKNIEIFMLNGDTDHLDSGIYISTTEHTKGLEFDQVIIWNENNYNINDNSEIKKLYVAITRGMHKLSVFTS